MAISRIIKRNGDIVAFEKVHISEAVMKAADSVSEADKTMSDDVADAVVADLEKRFHKNSIPAVEELQDTIEKVLIEKGYAKIAKAFILYRAKREEFRKAKEQVIGKRDDSLLTVSGLKIAEAKYLKKDKEGNVVETPNEMFRRVAKALAKVEMNYGYDKDFVQKLEDKFYEIMANLEFLPGGRTLANAGIRNGHLVNCFALPLKDSMKEIFSTLSEAMIIQRTGGGTGFDFSGIRAQGTKTSYTSGNAVGPMDFIKIFNQASNLVRSTGGRRGANMGVLRVDHPDIIKFITIKDNPQILDRFNLSVGITDKFMTAVKRETTYALIDPVNKEIVDRIDARKVFDILVTSAWKTGEPGLLFMDKINDANPTPKLGEIKTTSSCAEVPLLEYEACNIGSINLVKFVKEGTIDFEKLGEIVNLAVRLLDNVIDLNKYPIEKVEKVTKGNRKIGLGVMGFADLLYALKIPYGSDEGLKLGEQIMSFIQSKGHEASSKLAIKKGTFPNYKDSVYDGKLKMRNATITAIAPTGSLSMLADVSTAIEPNFAISYTRKVLDGNTIVKINRYFEDALKEKGLNDTNLIKAIAESGSVHNIKELPKQIRDVFVCSQDISPEWHLKMQSTFQKYVDNAISKTINFPSDASMKDIEKAFFTANELGCKGLTVYRDKSRDDQIVNLGK